MARRSFNFTNAESVLTTAREWRVVQTKNGIFHFLVTDDGPTWYDALSFDGVSGLPVIPVVEEADLPTLSADRVGALCVVNGPGDVKSLRYWDETTWVRVNVSETVELNPVTGALLGINTTADTTHRLAVSSPASLFNHAGAGHQQKINKNAAGDTASVLFQTGTSGRAEVGTTGDDDWHVKVSPNGSTWHEAIVVNRNTGRVSLPLTPQREVLTANRIYYVRTDGNDSNSGLLDNESGAFRTIVKAINVVFGEIDLAFYNVTIQVRAGTHAENIFIPNPHTGLGNVFLLGDTVTPSNVVISHTDHAVRVGTGVVLDVRGFKLVPPSGKSCLNVQGLGTIFFRNIDFGGGGDQIIIQGGGLIQATGAYTISAGGVRHWSIQRGGLLVAAGVTITLTGTPNFTGAFCLSEAGTVYGFSNTFVGAATGKRYDVNRNGVIHANGAGATYLPGSVDGTAASGGQYV